MRKLFIIIIIIFHEKTYATGMPVIDATAIGQIILMIEELQRQYDQMTEHLEVTQINSDYLFDQLESITGKNEFDSFYNTSSDKQARVWAPNSIEEFEDMVDHGFNPGDLSDRYSYYQEKFPAIPADTIDPKNPNSAQRDLYTYNEDWTKLSLVGFAQTFDAVNASYERINNLLEQANEHITLKESSDYSNRLLGELAYLLQNLIQVQNYDMHVKTMLQQAELNHTAAHANFYTFKQR